MKQIGEDSEKVASDLSKWALVNNNLVYLTNDDMLFIKGKDKEKDKIADDVAAFGESEYGHSIAYYTNLGELFIKADDEEPVRYLEDINKYSEIFFSNKLLYNRPLRYTDIEGIWMYGNTEDGIASFVEFNNKGEMIFYSVASYDYGGDKYNPEFTDESSYAGQINEEEMFSYEVTLENKDEITLDDYISSPLRLIRVSQEEMERRLQEDRKKLEIMRLGEGLVGQDLTLLKEALFKAEPKITGYDLGTLPQGEDLEIVAYEVDEFGQLWLDTYYSWAAPSPMWTEASNFGY